MQKWLFSEMSFHSGNVTDLQPLSTLLTNGKLDRWHMRNSNCDTDKCDMAEWSTGDSYMRVEWLGTYTWWSHCLCCVDVSVSHWSRLCPCCQCWCASASLPGAWWGGSSQKGAGYWTLSGT